MDLEKLKRFADSEYEGWKIAKAVTEVKNEIKNVEQGRDIAMSDYFKTLRDPLLEQQKKTDAKQDAVIEQLRENQRSLKEGLEELAFADAREEELAIAPPDPLTYNWDQGFDEKDKEVITKLGFARPSALFENKDLELVKKRIQEAGKIIKDSDDYLKTYFTKDGKEKDKKPGAKAAERIKDEKERKKALELYVDRLKGILASEEIRVRKGLGIRKYKQPKRNAYKIQNSSYGNLSIDVPKLINEMKLNAIRSGKIIYQADADKSLIDLLTKRFNPKRKYSMNAVRIFNDLNMLANLPKHKSSGKSRFVGSGVVFYQNPKELAERMKVLVGSMAAGNNSPVLKNDLSLINDEFLKIGAIDKGMHEKFYERYLK